MRDLPKSATIPLPVGETTQTVVIDSREYWMARALEAERKLALAANRSLSDSWERENHAREAQRQSDKRVGEMGGGG